MSVVVPSNEDWEPALGRSAHLIQITTGKKQIMFGHKEEIHKYSI